MTKDVIPVCFRGKFFCGFGKGVDWGRRNAVGCSFKFGFTAWQSSRDSVKMFFCVFSLQMRYHTKKLSFFQKVMGYP